ncbi:MAG: hypothetical protein V7K43_08045 [Nostoc sp.]
MSKYPILPGFLTTPFLRNAQRVRTLANAPLTQFFSLLITHYSLLITHYSLHPTPSDFSTYREKSGTRTWFSCMRKPHWLRVYLAAL